MQSWITAYILDIKHLYYVCHTKSSADQYHLLLIKIVKIGQAASSAKIKPNPGRKITAFLQFYANWA